MIITFMILDIEYFALQFSLPSGTYIVCNTLQKESRILIKFYIFTCFKITVKIIRCAHNVATTYYTLRMYNSAN